MSEQVPGQPDPAVPADQAPTVQQPAFAPPAQPAAQPVPEAAVWYPAPPVAEQAKQGVHVPKWVAAVAAVVLVGLGGFAIGKATSDDASNSRPAGFSQQGGQQGQQGGFGQQSGGSSGGSSQQGGQNGPMTRSGGS